MKLRILNFLNRLFLYRYAAYLAHRLTCAISPKLEIERNYTTVFKKKPNLDNPQNLIEKIYWIELNCDVSQWTLLADKYRMREYIAAHNYEQYLPKLYGHWDKVDDIDWAALPNSFVIKANNGCGTVRIIDDKSQTNIPALKRTLKQWLAIPYGYSNYQRHYTTIKPCLIAEERLEQSRQYNNISPNSLIDFKVWCFNGKPESVLITLGRTKSNHGRLLYDTQWNPINQHLRYGAHQTNGRPTEIAKPLCLDLMLEIASKLSEGHPQMRVDFYVINNRPVIGELTMATGYGGFTEEYYQHLGSLTDLTLTTPLPK